MPCMIICLTVVSFLLAATPLWARWESHQDNKSLPALQRMAAAELLIEAADVCIRSTSVELAVAGNTGREDLQAALRMGSESASYLRTIGEIARKQHGGKKEPGWMRKIVAAYTTKDPEQCVAAFRASYEPLTKTSQQPSLAITNRATMPRAEMRLQMLKSLFEKGLITKEQYEQKQAEILKEL